MRQTIQALIELEESLESRIAQLEAEAATVRSAITMLTSIHQAAAEVTQ